MVEAALRAIEEKGAALISLRELARRVGVTNAAAAHHFGDKAGLLTAIAAQGFVVLAGYVEAAAEEGDFGDVGVAYVRFARDRPAHFEVMFRPELYRTEDREVLEARARTAAALYGSAADVADAADGDQQKAAIAGWALVHGIATLWRDRNLPQENNDPVALAEQITPYLFQRSAAARGPRRPPRRT
jgi:AcrR family transcriptional regulator